MKKLLILGLVMCALSCTSPHSDIKMIDAKEYTTTFKGNPVSLYTLKSGKGLIMQVTNFGGRVVALWVPDRDGKYEDVTLGYKTIGEYVDNKGERFLGTVVGRYANRIAKGQFTLDSVQYQLPINNNGQTLHGGLIGLDMVAWTVDNVTDNEIILSHTSPDGSDGFPGTLNVKMTYTLTPQNEFKITYFATTDKPTVLNLSQHAFFNLKGEGNGTITDHVLTINADGIVPVDSVLIPTGEIMPVSGTPFDFRTATVIGARINDDHLQLKYGGGYDHNWVLNRKSANDVELAVTLYEPASGRQMEVWTDQPGVQFYSGNFFEGKTEGKYGRKQSYRESLALETQKFPDSPNQPNFPSTRLDPGEVYTHTCIYKFSTK